MVQGEIYRGRHTDHPAGRHSIRTNQCPPPPFPHILRAGCPSCRPTNSVKALKATSAFGLGEDARVLLNGVTCIVSVHQCSIIRKITSFWGLVSETRPPTGDLPLNHSGRLPSLDSLMNPFPNPGSAPALLAKDERKKQKSTRWRSHRQFCGLFCFIYLQFPVEACLSSAFRVCIFPVSPFSLSSKKSIFPLER